MLTLSVFIRTVKWQVRSISSDDETTLQRFLLLLAEIPILPKTSTKRKETTPLANLPFQNLRIWPHISSIFQLHHDWQLTPFIAEMHDLEKSRDEEGPASPSLGLLTPQDAPAESKSTSSPFQAIAWMVVNTLATVGIASYPPKEEHLWDSTNSIIYRSSPTRPSFRNPDGSSASSASPPCISS